MFSNFYRPRPPVRQVRYTLLMTEKIPEPNALRVPKELAQNERQQTGPERQRQELGIPKELASKNILYLGSHRGVYDVRFKGHLEAFQKIWEGGAIFPEKQTAYVDLSNSDPDEIVSLLRQFAERIDPVVKEEKLLPPPTSENMVPPAFIVNLIVLPALNEQGLPTDRKPSMTFALDSENYAHILAKLAGHLRELGTLEPSARQIEKRE